MICGMDHTNTDAQSFKGRLSSYKQLMDADIASYASQISASTSKNYGPSALLEVDAFLDILARGGKRVRGALVMLGYHMSGGTDEAMILQAARAIEMLHAYMLVMDDIQDRSAIRRGGPTAHVLLANYHKDHKLAGDAAHFGVAVALMSALTGAHAAQNIIGALAVDADLRLSALSIINRTIIITAHGQTNDIMNEVAATVTREDIDRVLLWKTAEYSFLNPLCVGMVLAGADCHATDAIRDYALNVGMAFQIADDISGTFGNEFDNGKSPMDDVREGKRTLLVMHALEQASPQDAVFLRDCLGDSDLNKTDFERCKQILTDTGAYAFAKAEAQKFSAVALAALGKEGARWPAADVAFLRDLATSVLPA